MNTRTTTSAIPSLARLLGIVGLSAMVLASTSCNEPNEILEDLFDANLGIPMVADSTLTATKGTSVTHNLKNTGQGTITGCRMNPALPMGLSLAEAAVDGALNANACQITGTVDDSVPAGTTMHTFTLLTTASSRDATLTLIVKEASGN